MILGRGELLTGAFYAEPQNYGDEINKQELGVCPKNRKVIITRNIQKNTQYIYRRSIGRKSLRQFSKRTVLK
jgi:hypothetical protein